MQDTCLSSSSTFGPHWNSYILQVDRERERERAPSHILYKHVCTGIAHSAYTLSELYLRSQKTQGKTSPTPCKRHPPLVDFLGKIWVKKLSEHWASLYRQLALHSFHWWKTQTDVAHRRSSNRSWVHSWKHRPFSNARKKGNCLIPTSRCEPSEVSLVPGSGSMRVWPNDTTATFEKSASTFAWEQKKFPWWVVWWCLGINYWEQISKARESP